MAAGGDRDAAVIRRAVRAGALVWGGVTLALIGVAFGAGGRTGALAVTLGFAAGAVITAGWLLLAGLLDMLAEHLPGRRRLAWTAGASFAALIAPMLVLGAAGGSGT